MTPPDSIKLAIVGSVGIDTIETPRARREAILGGSASYGCAAASFFVPVGMVGVVGDDFPQAYRDLYARFGIDCAGLQTQPGKTFRWSGVYEQNMDCRRTLLTELNVFAEFSPDLPEAYRRVPYLFLANISPDLQLHVLDQMTERPAFVMADTMDLWIDIARPALDALIARVDLLTLNESEARMLTGEHNLCLAARKVLAMGPRFALIKKGENGSLLFSDQGVYIQPAFPLESFDDPTGAGDAFAGGFMGALAAGDDVGEPALRRAMRMGSVVASFAVEAFSLERLDGLTREAIDDRAACFQRMVHVG